VVDPLPQVAVLVLQVFVQFVHIVEQQDSLPEAVLQLLESVLHVHVHFQVVLHAVQHSLDAWLAQEAEEVQVCLQAESHSSQHVVAARLALEQSRPDVVSAHPVYVDAPLYSHVYKQAESHSDGETVLVTVQFVHIVEQQDSLPEAVSQLLESVLHVHVHSQDGSVHAVQHYLEAC
jgi:hypothetical protein